MKATAASPVNTAEPQIFSVLGVEWTGWYFPVKQPMSTASSGLVILPALCFGLRVRFRTAAASHSLRRTPSRRAVQTAADGALWKIDTCCGVHVLLLKDGAPRTTAFSGVRLVTPTCYQWSRSDCFVIYVQPRLLSHAYWRQVQSALSEIHYPIPPVTLWAVQASSYQQKHKNNTTSLSMSCCKLPRDNARTLKASCCAFYGLVSGTVLQDLWSTWNIFDRVSMSNIYQSALSSHCRYSGKCINIVVSSVHHLTASLHNRMFHASLCRMLFSIHSLL